MIRKSSDACSSGNVNEPALGDVTREPVSWMRIIPTPDIPEQQGHICLGDRKICRKFLQKHDIEVVSGRLGFESFGKGGFGSVRRFYISEKCKDSKLEGDWVFKAEYPVDKDSYQKKYGYADKYPISPSGYIHTTLRSVVSYKIAQQLGVDNFVETHIGFAGNTHGMIMKEVKGITVHEWLIREGYFQNAALEMGYTEDDVGAFLQAKGAYRDKGFKSVIRSAFHNCIAENVSLFKQWKRIQTVDYHVGQGDRKQFNNMMIVFDKDEKPEKLMAVDNDFSIPVDNGHLSIANIPVSFENDNIVDFEKVGNQLIETLFPESGEASRERWENLNKWFFNRGDDYKAERIIQSPNDIVCSEVGSGDCNSGGYEHKQVHKFNIMEEPAHFNTDINTGIRRRACCIIL